MKPKVVVKQNMNTKLHAVDGVGGLTADTAVTRGTFRSSTRLWKPSCAGVLREVTMSRRLPTMAAYQVNP